MSWFLLPRKPEPEVMSDKAEAEAYGSAAAQEYLDALDDTLVEQAVSILQRGAAPRRRLLDVGCGPGGIALKIARREPALAVVGVDRSSAMIQLALRAAEAQGLSGQASFLRADGNCLCFPDSSFDFVISNSVLHHLPDPVRMLREMARVARPEGAILVRDLRRPARPFFHLHIWWHGRYYSGLMQTLYRNSVRAAYNVTELAQLLADAGLNSARVFTHRRTHIGFVRPPVARLGPGAA
jgi:ubiquinone/menaquinone biosynthesis C-methylase UbiE